MPVLSSLISSPSLHFDSHTLTIIPDCFFLSHLFPWRCIFTSPQWARFFSRVGSTLLKLSGSPICMMRSTPGILERGILHVGTAIKTQPTLLGGSQRDHLANRMALLQTLISTRHLRVPTHFTSDSS